MATKDEICRLTNITRNELDSGSFDLTLTGDIVDCLPDSLELYGLTLNGCVSLKSLPEDVNISYLSLLDCPNITHRRRSMFMTALLKRVLNYSVKASISTVYTSLK